MLGKTPAACSLGESTRDVFQGAFQRYEPSALSGGLRILCFCPYVFSDILVNCHYHHWDTGRRNNSYNDGQESDKMRLNGHKGDYCVFEHTPLSVFFGCLSTATEMHTGYVLLRFYCRMIWSQSSDEYHSLAQLVSMRLTDQQSGRLSCIATQLVYSDGPSIRDHIRSRGRSHAYRKENNQRLLISAHTTQGINST